MIARENLLAFLGRWASQFIEASTSSLNLLAIIAAFLTVFGLSLTASNLQIYAVIGLAAYLILIAARTRPELYLHPVNFVSQRIDVDKLNNFIVQINRVGLIGKQNVGKTTFLDLTVARTNLGEQTDRPYAQIVALPDTSPLSYVAIIDSVGQRDHIQFEIQNHSDLIILFVDHAETSTELVADDKRIEQEVYFASQLVAAKEAASPPNGVIIVMNKSDLWTKNADAVRKIGELRDQLVGIFRDSGKYTTIDVVERNSNHSPKDASALLAKVRDYYGTARRR